MKTPKWIDKNWSEGLNELEYGFATGTFKDAYWRKLVGHSKWVREEVYDEETLMKIYQSNKPIRVMEWRPIYVNLLKTQFVNEGKEAWKIFKNPHTEEAKQNYVEMFDYHTHNCFCCETEGWEVQTSPNFIRNMRT